MYELIYTGSYEKRARKFVKKHPELLKQYEKTLRLLELNPCHPSIRLHKLKGKLSEFFSISINMTYRISIELIIDGEKIIPINVGDHDEVYQER